MNQQVFTSTDPEQLQKELVGSFTKFESSFRKRFPVIWIATLLAPLVVSALLLLLFGVNYGWKFAGVLASHVVLTFFVFGRFIILAGSSKDIPADTGLQPDAALEVGEKFQHVLMSPLELFGLVTYLDFMTALFVTFHMGFLFRIPGVGPKIATLVWDGKFVMEAQPWIRRFAFLGLVAFVMFPTSTTGSIGGSIFGRLLGLSRFTTVMGVLVGSIFGNGLMYLLSNQLNSYISKDDIWLKVVGAVLIVALCVAVEWRYRQVKKKFLVKEGVDQPANPETGDGS
jgi:uncharacterized membrane protein